MYFSLSIKLREKNPGAAEVSAYFIIDFWRGRFLLLFLPRTLLEDCTEGVEMDYLDLLLHNIQNKEQLES